MGRHHDLAPLFDKGVDSTHGQGRRLLRLGAAPDLVDQHELPAGCVLVHMRDRLHVGREGRKLHGNILLVPHYRINAGEKRDPRGSPGRNEHARRRHEQEETRCLQRNGLPVRIWPADDGRPLLFADNDIDGYGLFPFGEQDKRVDSPSYLDRPAHLYPGPYAIERGGEKGKTLMQVKVGDERKSRLHLRHIPADPSGQIPEYPLFLFLFLILQHADRVVDFHDLDRLYEGCFQGMRVIVDNALKKLIVVRLERYHISAVADGNIRILHYRPHLIPLHYPLEGSLRLFLQLVKVGPDLGQLVRGAVLNESLLVYGLLDPGAHFRQALYALHNRLDIRALFHGFFEERQDPPAARQELCDSEEIGYLQGKFRKRQPGRLLPYVGNVTQRDRAVPLDNLKGAIYPLLALFDLMKCRKRS